MLSWRSIATEPTRHTYIVYYYFVRITYVMDSSAYAKQHVCEQRCHYTYGWPIVWCVHTAYVCVRPFLFCLSLGLLEKAIYRVICLVKFISYLGSKSNDVFFFSFLATHVFSLIIDFLKSRVNLFKKHAFSLLPVFYIKTQELSYIILYWSPCFLCICSFAFLVKKIVSHRPYIYMSIASETRRVFRYTKQNGVPDRYVPNPYSARVRRH